MRQQASSASTHSTRLPTRVMTTSPRPTPRAASAPESPADIATSSPKCQTRRSPSREIASRAGFDAGKRSSRSSIRFTATAVCRCRPGAAARPDRVRRRPCPRRASEPITGDRGPGRLRRPRLLRPRPGARVRRGAAARRCASCTRTSARSCSVTASRSAGAGAAAPRPRLGRGRALARGVASWEQAALRGACGLAIERRRRAGAQLGLRARAALLARGRGATYFASRIDPLVAGSPAAAVGRLGRLGVDDDPSLPGARADAVRRDPAPRPVLDDPPAPRAHPRRAPVMALGRDRAQRSASTQGADAWVAGLREMLDGAPGAAALPAERRARLADRDLRRARPGREVTALTVDDDEGGRFEEDHAEPVVRALGVAHEELRGAPEDYPADWEQRARRVEYQFVDHPWLVPLARRIGGATAPVLDGGAIDVSFQAGDRFYTAASLDTSRPREASAALWETVRRFGHAQLALAERFREPLVARAREQFMAEMRRFEGHPSQGILGVYWTRTVRGTSSYPTGCSATGAGLIVPGARHALASVGARDPAGDQARRSPLPGGARAGWRRRSPTCHRPPAPSVRRPACRAAGARSPRSPPTASCSPRARSRGGSRPSSAPGWRRRRAASSAATCAWASRRSPCCTPGGGATATDSARSTPTELAG